MSPKKSASPEAPSQFCLKDRILDNHRRVFGIRLPFMYTLHDMISLGGHRRHGRNRLFAYILLAATFALTSTPICGSVSDVDPVGCCERHACAQDAASRNRTAHLPQSLGGCCSKHGEIYGASNGAAKCCELGSLNYPKVKPQPASAVTTILPLISTMAVATLVPTTTRSQQVDAKTLLKIPLVPLYTLYASYRI